MSLKNRVYGLVLLLVAAFLPALAFADSPREGDRVAICGDSITEQKDYSVLIENYLLMCQPAAQVRSVQFGWGGETSWGFLGRMANDVLWCKPDVATTCYGMNDGGYSPMTEEKATRYKNAQKGIVQTLKKAGVRMIIVGSPGVVDADTFRRSPEQAVMYNKTLAALRDIAKGVAQEEGVLFANVFDPMMDVMTKTKAKYGHDYNLAGGDGVHPARNGHLVMAYAFLKAMGCDGNIGTITVDLAADKAQATPGHKILSCQGGAVEVESTRYPFCFFGDPASPSSSRGVLEFLPFNEELNRFKLVVRGATAGRVKVTWGQATKEFAAADLAKGINLAAEFLDNPFGAQFQKVEQAVRTQQNYETTLHKVLLHELPAYRSAAPDEGPALERVAKAVQARQKALSDNAAATVVPVRHTIKVEVAQ
ncbi:MAG: SGNH/GDSL hydrolase family protein [Bacillota bacterium]